MNRYEEIELQQDLEQVEKYLSGYLRDPGYGSAAGQILRDMESAFREILNCRKVNLHVDDIPEEEPGGKKPYMPEEKAKDLMDKHPEVRAFVADLGLDTK